MLELDEIRKRLQHRSANKVAEATGLSNYTIWKVRNSKGGVNYNTVVELSKYLEENP